MRWVKRNARCRLWRRTLRAFSNATPQAANDEDENQEKTKADSDRQPSKK
jgi:hypothetical protein